MLSRLQLHGLLITLAHSDLTYLCLHQTQSGASAVGLLDVALAVIATRLWRLMWQHYYASTRTSTASASASASGAACAASSDAACVESCQNSPHHWNLTTIQELLVEQPRTAVGTTTAGQTQEPVMLAASGAATLSILMMQPPGTPLLAERGSAPLEAPSRLPAGLATTRQQNSADVPSPDLDSAWCDYYLPDQLLQTVECYLDLQLQRQLHPESLIRYRRF